MSNDQRSQDVLPFKINGEKFEWPEEYIIGLEVRELGRIPADASLFLEIEAPWENEMILNDTRINLARPGIEQFVSKERHPDTIVLTIETPKGKWENGVFHKHLTINQLIEKVIKRFTFELDGNYQLRVKGQSENLSKQATLESLHLKDHTVLIFIDLGKGAAL